MALQKNSLFHRMQSLEVGERLYLERDKDEYLSVQRKVTAKTRYPESMKDRRYSTSLFTAVGAEQVGTIRFLVCIERTA